MTTDTTGSTHPVVACAAAVRAAVTDVAGSQPVFMTTGDKATALVELAAAQAQLTELKLRILAAADDVAAVDGSRDASAWLANQTQAEPRTTRADLELAHALDGRYPGVAAGMATGDVTTAHARVMVDVLDDLATSDAVDTDLLARAEQTLVGYAGQFRPTQLRRIGRHLLDILAPEIAEHEEARRLAAQDAHARQKARLTLRPVGDGTTRIAGLLPDPIAARLRTYLDAYTSPRHHHDTPGTAEADRIPPTRQRAHAFAALLEHLDPHALPEHGGDATTVMVTIGLDQLKTELASASLIDTGDGDSGQGANLTAAHARRLACTASIIPIVLGGPSEILDQGRARRLFTPAQRKAMRLRDRQCRAEGCTIPATWTEAHHLDPWTTGGKTNLADGISLCTWHHHRTHDPGYRTDHLPNGDLRFHRRT